MRDTGHENVNLQALHQVLGSSLIWAGAAFVLVMALLFSTIRIGKVTGEQVGIQLHRVTGKISVIPQSGVKIYNGLLSDFYVLDKTLQTLEMKPSCFCLRAALSWRKLLLARIFISDGHFIR